MVPGKVLERAGRYDGGASFYDLTSGDLGSSSKETFPADLETIWSGTAERKSGGDSDSVIGTFDDTKTIGD